MNKKNISIMINKYLLFGIVIGIIFALQNIVPLYMVFLFLSGIIIGILITTKIFLNKSLEKLENDQK